MGVGRKPLQGVLNIVCFNWHFYVIAALCIISSGVSSFFMPERFQLLALLGSGLAGFAILVSLFASYYVYDVSNLYQLPWLPDLNGKTVLNINAGFDETSLLLQDKYTSIDLRICDFYDPGKHTEVSIERARNAYPPHENSVAVSTEKLPFSDQTFDCALAILSVHEIRNDRERDQFFKELARVVKPTGQIMVTEHLRDFNNFVAYTIGFLHFHSRKTWLDTFEKFNLAVQQEVKTTPLVTTFLLEKQGCLS